MSRATLAAAVRELLELRVLDVAEPLRAHPRAIAALIAG
jgi:hypothetical protein